MGMRQMRTVRVMLKNAISRVKLLDFKCKWDCDRYLILSKINLYGISAWHQGTFGLVDQKQIIDAAERLNGTVRCILIFRNHETA